MLAPALIYFVGAKFDSFLGRKEKESSRELAGAVQKHHLLQSAFIAIKLDMASDQGLACHT